MTHVGAYAWEAQRHPRWYPVRGNFNVADMTYWRAFGDDQSARERRSAYLTAVYAANDRELRRFHTARAVFTDAAGRYIAARKTYWHQIEGASVSESWRIASGELDRLTDAVKDDVRSTAHLMGRFDYLSGQPIPAYGEDS